MGIAATYAKLLFRYKDKYGLKGNCLTMGKQDVLISKAELQSIVDSSRQVLGCSSGTFSRKDTLAAANSSILVQESMDDRYFFESLGITSVDSLDASYFEGADYVFDMNDTGLFDAIGKKFDLVFEGGTAEHVFHIPNYFANIADIVEVGGKIVQFLPVNNMVDHGFYQFSPTMLHSFYEVNGFTILEMTLIFASDAHVNECEWRSYQPGEFDTMDKSLLKDCYMMIGIVVQKETHSTAHIIPQQRIYQNDLNWIIGRYMSAIQELPEIAFLVGPFIKNEGYCWEVKRDANADFQQLKLKGDTAQLPKASRLILLEDGQIIGPAHTIHEDIRKLGGGCYSHWGNDLYFSTSDNSDPNKNGRRYSIKLFTDK